MKSEIEWGQYVKALANFVLAESRHERQPQNVTGRSGFELTQIAGQVLVIKDNKLISIREIFDELCSRRFIQNSQIFEAWEYQVAQRVITYSKTLTSIESRALQVFTGYSEASLGTLGSEASSAIESAYIALYGDSA